MFRINTNTQAMGALRNLGNSGVDLNKSMTRLSTGLRINSASDDPAGLIASETFRAQISGIDQAVRNNQDAQNYAKTAEGALDEVSKLLTDARSLAVASGNGATLTDAQRQANQQQLNSIVGSINRISSSTSFGSKKLLDGSSGVTAGVSNTTNIGAISLSGTFGSSAITSTSNVTLQVTAAATRGTVATTATFAAASTIATATSLNINGSSVNIAAGDSIQNVINRINQNSAQTGVSADLSSTGTLRFQTNQYGSKANVTVVDGSGVLFSSTQTATGTNAAGTVSIANDGTNVTTVNFTSALSDGLTLRDDKGNSIKLTEVGNATGAAAVIGRTSVGATSFQIGANSGDTAQLSLGNFAAAGLGDGVVSGVNMGNASLLTDTGASDAMKVIDRAIEQVSSARGRIGNFIRNTIDTNIRSLGVARENLSASESSIRDVDFAQEMTNYTKLQILQQSGMSMLAQANSAPQSVLSLLR